MYEERRTSATRDSAELERELSSLLEGVDCKDHSAVEAALHRESKEPIPADVFFGVGLYDSVLVSAFGGVTMNLDGSEELHIPPGVLFMFCIPLVMLQFWLTFCTTFVLSPHWRDHPGEFSEDAMSSRVKVLLVVVVQLMFFDNLLMTLRCLMFVLNPTTWTDVRRVTLKGSWLDWLHWPPVVAPFSVLAILMKAFIHYYVSIQSMSIIFSSADVKEAIFDSLAIGFLVELDVAAWNFVKTVLHLDPFDQFTFELWPESKRAYERSQSCFAKHVDASCLHRGRGGRALEGFIVFTVMFLVYSRITLMVLHAMDTGILPVARDVCAMWRWHRGEYRDWFDRIWGATYETVLYVMTRMAFIGWGLNVDEKVDEVADPARDGYCDEHIKVQMNFHVASDLFWKYPKEVTSFLCFFGMILLVPQLIVSTGAMRQVVKRFEDVEDVAEESHGEPLEISFRKIKDLKVVTTAVLSDHSRRLKRLEKRDRASEGAPGQSRLQPAALAPVLRPQPAPTVLAQDSSLNTSGFHGIHGVAPRVNSRATPLRVQSPFPASARQVSTVIYNSLPMQR
eukprot:TRINITY_DN18378_c0_g1_i1.p1 TRINITY_DN18378_c0_g1~~TRINITY_DN18378_c0_g1_i1.p1  ORF type:complete len:565 (-),score=67.90 TRINITY_DN18378_c0_g1_i1:104-1798(-)